MNLAEVILYFYSLQPLNFFATTYKVEDEQFAFFVIADDLVHAQQIADQRGIGEVIVGQLESNPMAVPVRNANSILHSLCFASYIALKSGKATPEQILGDRGVLHEFVHILDDSADAETIKNINQKIQWLFELSGISAAPCIGNTIGFI